MDKTELKQYGTILTAKRIELASQLRKRDGIAIEKTPDASDEVRLAAERELMTRKLEQESKRLRDVQAALERIEQGIYGVCLNCEEEIRPKRLNAVPWASLCIDCQELEDQHRHGHSEGLPKAA